MSPDKNKYMVQWQDVFLGGQRRSAHTREETARNYIKLQDVEDLFIIGVTSSVNRGFEFNVDMLGFCLTAAHSETVEYQLKLLIGRRIILGLTRPPIYSGSRC